jgi:putative oxygen-independent coproporphyrinogen III oxidase
MPLGVYVHFPWCVRKCPYCDFNSHPLKGELLEVEYRSALEQDVAASRADLERARKDTVFFGGGTPSLFSPPTFAFLLELIGGQPAEVTLEANPGTTEFHDFAEYRQAGINRLSIGAQTFSDTMLHRLGRIHSARETVRAFELARAGGFDNINLDLMYGLPDQSVDDALGDLDAAIALGPEHLSWYELTLEPKTEFHRRPPKLPVENVMLDMESAGHDRLIAAGYERYEVSAWSKPGRRCAHNLNYWTFGDYVGLGAGAHGKVDRGGRIVRTTRPGQPRLYLAEPKANNELVVPTDQLRGEFLMNVLRLKDGVPKQSFVDRTGLSLSTLEPEWQQGVSAGLLRADRIATTAQGYAFLDTVLQSFL